MPVASNWIHLHDSLETTARPQRVRVEVETMQQSKKRYDMWAEFGSDHHGTIRYRGMSVSSLGRCVVHAALASNRPAIHLTFSFRPFFPSSAFAALFSSLRFFLSETSSVFFSHFARPFSMSLSSSLRSLSESESESDAQSSESMSSRFCGVEFGGVFDVQRKGNVHARLR